MIRNKNVFIFFIKNNKVYETELGLTKEILFRVYIQFKEL